MTIRLSILDQSIAIKGRPHAAAIQDTLALAEHAERLGYHRFWVSEHHNHATIVDRASLISERQRFDLMLTVGSSLHEHRARFGLMHVDQRDADLVGRHPIHQCTDIGGQSRTAVLRIEIPQPSV